MERTQIYLSQKQKKALKAIALRLGKTQSELIRAEIDHLIDRKGQDNRLESLRIGRGMWRNRADLPNFDLVRPEIDRTEP